MSARVAVTGFALASPFGGDPEIFWRGLLDGPAPIQRWTSEPLYPGVACLAALLPESVGAATPAAHRYRGVLSGLVGRALRHAGLDAAPPGCGLAIGSHWLDNDCLPLEAVPPSLPRIAEEHGLTGPVANFPVACAAGNVATTFAWRAVRSGQAPIMLAGGLDLVGVMAAGSFVLFDNLTETTPRPFSADRDGFLLGEGGALFVLEPLDAARAAGRRIWAELCGAGAGHDGFHPTRPEPGGRGLRRAVAEALGFIPASSVGYVNAHSPGTLANDPVEALVYRDVFGEGGVPVSSTKSVIGHAQGGANALESLACILALDRQVLPPTHHTVAAEAGFGIDLIAGAPRARPLEYALNAAASMGGANSVLLFGRGEP